MCLFMCGEQFEYRMHRRPIRGRKRNEIEEMNGSTTKMEYFFVCQNRHNIIIIETQFACISKSYKNCHFSCSPNPILNRFSFAFRSVPDKAPHTHSRKKNPIFSAVPAWLFILFAFRSTQTLKWICCAYMCLYDCDRKMRKIGKSQSAYCAVVYNCCTMYSINTHESAYMHY